MHSRMEMKSIENFTFNFSFKNAVFYILCTIRIILSEFYIIVKKFHL